MNLRDDLALIFKEYELNEILSENYVGTFSAFYENNMEKIVVNKNINDCSIRLYYKNGSLMFEYNWTNKLNISFTRYSSNGNIIYSKNYNLGNFSIFLETIPPDNTIPIYILLLYKILDTSNLDNLINRFNYNLTTSNFKENRVSLKNSKASKISSESKSVKNKIINKIDENSSMENNCKKVSLENDGKSLKVNIKEEKSAQNSGITELSDTIYDNSDIKDGPFRLYYENNAVKSTGTYKNVKLDGLYTEYYPNGRIKTEGHYENGDKKGLWKFFTDSGTLEREENY